MRAREGDFLKSKERLYFDVKGLIHPPDRIIAFLRYVPDEKSEKKYRKVYDLSERRDILKRYYPRYLYFDRFFGMELQAVPIEDVEAIYDPRERVDKLKGSKDPVEAAAYRMIKRLREVTDIPPHSLGVSGSILVNLHTKRSDIDIIVYGTSNAVSCSLGLANLLREGEDFKRYDRSDIYRLYHQRGMSFSVDFETFHETEGKKVFQGIYRRFDYFIRCVRDWDEIDEKYGEKTYTPLGSIEVRAKVSDASESLLTPSVYKIEVVEIDREVEGVPDKIVSYRGRFCEQAVNGDVIAARGKLERVTSTRLKSYRIVIGESKNDYMYPIREGS